MFANIFHYVGSCLKYVGAAAIFCFSASLGYAFFQSIAPPSMPWFVWAAMGLTEVGLLIWLAAFRLQHHHDAHKSVAFVMIFLCLFAVGLTDAVELARLFGVPTLFAGIYYYGLIVLLLAHFLAFIIDEFIKEGEKFQRGNISGNIIPTRREINSHATVKEEEPRPLAQIAQWDAVRRGISGGANSAMRKARRAIGSGKPAAHAPGKASATTSAIMSASEEVAEKEKEEEEEKGKAEFPDERDGN